MRGTHGRHRIRAFALGTATAVVVGFAASSAPTRAVASPPGASLGGHATGAGFDACHAPSAAAMAAWKTASPYAIANIYIGGVNRACSQPNLTAAWVRTVTRANWRLIPTYVGLQSPCGPVSYQLSHANEGTAAADDAVTKAIALGLYAGTPIYYDMEAYGRSASCVALTTAYLDAWTRELHRLGYRSGIYSSAASGITDLVARYRDRTFASPDDVWIANWNGVRTTSDPYVPASYWAGHRIRQYAANVTESYGGYTINIDRNLVDGDVAGQPAFLAGPPVGVNGPWTPVAGDFDGDGKTDILWYQPGPAPEVITRATGGGRFTLQRTRAVNAHYQPIVGDFDGDGRSDIIWYAPGAAHDYLWRGAASSSMFTPGPAVNIGGVYTPIVGDFNGDGRSDILWYGPGPGHDYVWLGASGSTPYVVGPHVAIGARYFPIAGDFDGDGCSDILWYAPGTAHDYLWRGSRASVFWPGIHVNISGTYFPIAGDFDGDGRADILWDGVGSGPDYLWRGTATGFATGQPVNVNNQAWPVVGDFNGDGGSDVLWFDPSGPDRLWFGN